MPIFDSLVKPALDSVTGLISEFHMSPEDKAKAQQALADATAKAQEVALSYDAKLNDIAGQNIRADAQSGDKFTERARPSFLYLVMAILALDYIVLPIAQIFGSHIAPFALPDNLMWLFGVGITGYAFSRTLDKALALPGDSQVNALWGMVKAGNKQ